jgi:hypothetical protein
MPSLARRLLHGFLSFCTGLGFSYAYYRSALYLVDHVIAWPDIDWFKIGQFFVTDQSGIVVILLFWPALRLIGLVMRITPGRYFHPVNLGLVVFATVLGFTIHGFVTFPFHIMALLFVGGCFVIQFRSYHHSQKSD